MNLFSITGLSLDLTGVLLLGFDLVRVQRRLRGDAQDRIARLDTILEEIGGIEGWAKTVPSDFRDYDWDEGRAIPLDGTFDTSRARESFDDALDTIERVGSHVLTLANMQLAVISADRDTAGLSLRYTYLGLAMIVVGFLLQLPAYLMT